MSALGLGVRMEGSGFGAAGVGLNYGGSPV